VRWTIRIDVQSNMHTISDTWYYGMWWWNGRTREHANNVGMSRLKIGLNVAGKERLRKTTEADRDGCEPIAGRWLVTMIALIANVWRKKTHKKWSKYPPTTMYNASVHLYIYYILVRVRYVSEAIGMMCSETGERRAVCGGGGIIW